MNKQMSKIFTVNITLVNIGLEIQSLHSQIIDPVTITVVFNHTWHFVKVMT